MKALRANRYGDPVDVVTLDEVPDPETLAPGHVRVAILATPINPSNLIQLRGYYGVPLTFPALLGTEGAGRVVAVADDVEQLAVGDRVVVPPGAPTWLEYTDVPAARCIPVAPDGDIVQYAMLGINPPTALAMLTDVTTLAAGVWVIQNGANSGVGVWVNAIATARGLRCINVVRSEEAARRLRDAGTSNVLVDGDDLPTRVRELTGSDERPQLGLDCVAGSASARLAASLGHNATLVNYGAMGGGNCEVSAGDMIFRSLTVRGFWLVTWFQTTPGDRIRAAFAELTALLQAGAVTVPVAATYPLDAYAEAFSEATGTAGKILFTPSSG